MWLAASGFLWWQPMCIGLILSPLKLATVFDQVSDRSLECNCFRHYIYLYIYSLRPIPGIRRDEHLVWDETLQLPVRCH